VSTVRAGELATLHRAVSVERYRSLVLHWVRGWFRPLTRAPRRPTGGPGGSASGGHPVAVGEADAITSGQLEIAFGGHATVLARYPSLAIAFDPMLGRWVGGVRREALPGLGASDFRDVGLILISHRHADHLHRPTLRQLPRAATVIVPGGGAAALSGLGFARVVELQPGSDLELRGVQITAAATSHGGSTRARGLSYLIRGDGPSLYLCGDSGYFSGYADLGERYAPDIAMLPIGGFVPDSFRDRHMSPLDALFAFQDLRSRLLIPIHHSAFALSYEKLGEPVRWLCELATARGVRDKIQILAAGETVRLDRALS